VRAASFWSSQNPGACIVISSSAIRASIPAGSKIVAQKPGSLPKVRQALDEVVEALLIVS
jgi:hypothetical protein